MNAPLIAQSLHGYADGHRLLASSRKLSPLSQRVLRTMTDLSGPRLVRGFSEYLTGFILPDDRMYAFARTWYADEAERPGCVWTHTLLLNDDALADVEDLEPLLGLFRRPKSNSGFEYYQDDLTTPSNLLLNTGLKNFAGIEHIIKGLYGTTSCVILPDNDSNSLESTHLALWKQYRALAATNLQFCTGAIQPRQAAVGRFDLQTVPTHNLRDIGRTSSAFTIVDFKKAPPQDAWVKLFVEDLHGHSSFDLNAFLKTYASSPWGIRPALGAYAKLFIALLRSTDEARSAGEVLGLCAELFPEASDARSLKTALAGPIEERGFFQTREDGDILGALLASEPSGAFDTTTLHISDRLVALRNSNPDAALRLFIEAKARPSGVAASIVKAFADSLHPEDVPWLLQQEAKVAAAVLIRRPALAAEKRVWNGPAPIRETLLEAISESPHLADAELFPILHSQIDVGVENVAGPMVQAFGTRVAEAALLWARTREKIVPKVWRDALTGLGIAYTEWASARLRQNEPQVLCFLITPDDSVALDIDPALWVDTLKLLPLTPEGEKSSSFSATVLCLGLSRTDDIGADMIAASFPHVYRAAASGVLTETAWHSVASRAAASWWWDKCRVLRIAIVQKFANTGWKTDHFVRALPDDRTFWDMVSMWGWDDREKAFLAQVIADIVHGRIEASDSFRRSAHQSAGWFGVRF